MLRRLKRSFENTRRRALAPGTVTPPARSPTPKRRSPTQSNPTSLPEHVFARHIATRLAATNLVRAAQASKGMRGLVDPSLRQRKADVNRLSRGMQAAASRAARPFAVHMMQMARAIREFHAHPSRKNQIVARLRQQGWDVEEDTIFENFDVGTTRDGYTSLPALGEEPTGIHIDCVKYFMFQGTRYNARGGALLDTPKFRFKPSHMKEYNFIMIEDRGRGVFIAENLHTNQWVMAPPQQMIAHDQISTKIKYLTKIAALMVVNALGVTMVPYKK